MQSDSKWPFGSIEIKFCGSAGAQVFSPPLKQRAATALLVYFFLTNRIAKTGNGVAITGFAIL